LSNKPRIGSCGHAERYPDKLSLYNANYEVLPPYVKVEEYKEPWLVDRGWKTLGQFDSFDEALAFMLERVR